MGSGGARQGGGQPGGGDVQVGPTGLPRGPWSSGWGPGPNGSTPSLLGLACGGPADATLTRRRRGRRQDEAKLKELSLEVERLTQEVATKQEELGAEVRIKGASAGATVAWAQQQLCWGGPRSRGAHRSPG